MEEEPQDPNLIKSYYDNGKLKAEVRINDSNKRHGLSTSYYESGIVKTEITYNNGKKEKAIQYYESGKPYVEFNYKNGLKHGKRIKYWESGNIQSVLEYSEDRPGIGLEEYNKRGKKITKYPNLILKQIDNLSTSGQYIIEAYFDNNPQRADYYIGELDSGFLKFTYAPMNEVNHKGRMVFKPLPGTFRMEKLKIIGKYKTYYGNPYLVEKSINLAIDY